MSDLTAAIAAADQQLTLVNQTLDTVAVKRARELLAEHDETSAWALLGMEICRSLDLIGKHRQFAGEMVAAAAIRLAKQ